MNQRNMWLNTCKAELAIALMKCPELNERQAFAIAIFIMDNFSLIHQFISSKAIEAMEKVISKNDPVN